MMKGIYEFGEDGKYALGVIIWNCLSKSFRMEYHYSNNSNSNYSYS